MGRRVCVEFVGGLFQGMRWVAFGVEYKKLFLQSPSATPCRKGGKRVGCRV